MRQAPLVSKLRQVLLLSTLPLTLTAFAPTAAQSFTFSGLYVFGDSLSDSGNAFNATGGLLPPEPFYTAGRFTNGPVWVEYLAPKLGLTFNPATDFAFGGATTGAQNTFVPGLPGLQQQITGFTQSTPIADPNALYIVWAGANDYLGGASTLDPLQPVQQPVANLVGAAQALAGVGAQTIVLANLPNLGQLPGTQGHTQLTALSAAHDAVLAQAIQQLAQTEPSVQVIPFDVAALFSDAIAQPNNYGFTNVTDACLLTLCQTPDTYLFWDSIHPTTAGHERIAEAAATTIVTAGRAAGVPEPPTTLGLFTFGALLAGAAAWKRHQRSKMVTIDSLKVQPTPLVQR
jgi:phospholipase/lecithinase/hemolysin